MKAGRREMRKQTLGTIIALLAIVLAAGAQTPGTEPTVTRAALQKVAVVPPAYAPKKDVASIEPPVRAVDAATKFVERPEGNLLPVANAAMQGTDQSSSTASAPAASAAIQPAVNLAAEQKTHPQATNGPKYTGEPISV